MAGKPKLHELIAVEGELQAANKKILEETAHVFKDKEKHFLGVHKQTFMLSSDETAKLQEGEESLALTTTVPLKLEHMATHVIRYFDAILQKERTNQEAKADLVVDGATLVKDAPATWLLGLEDRLKAVRAVYDVVPTHPQGKIWTEDKTSALKGAFVASEKEKRIKTQKITKPVVLYAATEQHPAQVKEVTEDVPVGSVVGTYYSGMVSPAEKSDMLERLDKLIRAVKKARMRANGAEVVKVTAGKVLIDYVNKGSVPGGAAAAVDESD